MPTGPSARSMPCFELNPSQSRLILYGGNTGTSLLNDLWTFSISSSQWTQEIPTGTLISTRYSHACAYNTQNGLFYVHGGLSNLNDLWNYDFGVKQWSLVDSGNANVGLYGHQMKYSQSLDSLLILLGRNINVGTSSGYTQEIYRYTFAQSSAGWTLVQTTVKPPARNFYATGFNTATGEFFAFGGYGATKLLSTCL